MVDVENHHRDRPAGLGLALDHPGTGFGKAAAVEQAGQRIRRRRGLVHGDRAFRHQHEDHEHGADRIEHQLDREHGDPDAVGKVLVMRAQEIAEQDRQHQHAAMRDRYCDRRPAPLHRTAALVPQFAGGERGIDRNDGCADRQPQRGLAGQQRRHGGEPEDRAQHHAGPDWPCGPGTRARRSRPCRRTGRRPWSAPATSGAPSLVPRDRPERDRGRAEQIGGAPPFQRRDVLLPAEEHQHRAKHGRDHRRDDDRALRYRMTWCYRAIVMRSRAPEKCGAHVRTLERPRWQSVVVHSQVFTKNCVNSSANLQQKGRRRLLPALAGGNCRRF